MFEFSSYKSYCTKFTGKASVLQDKLTWVTSNLWVDELSQASCKKLLKNKLHVFQYSKVISRERYGIHQQTNKTILIKNTCVIKNGLFNTHRNFT